VFDILSYAMYGIIGWFLFSVLSSRLGVATYKTYVLTRWFASETPNSEGVYIRIVGRKDGVIAWIFSILGIEPDVSLVVDREKVRFTESSWTGGDSWVTPLGKLCSGNYGYHKPFWSAAIWFGIGAVILFSSFQKGLIVVGLLVMIAAVAYYYLNIKLVLGLTYVNGKGQGFAFKRSAIEGVSVDDGRAAQVVAIIEALVTHGVIPSQSKNPSTTLPELHPATPQIIASTIFCHECGSKNTSTASNCTACGTTLNA